jgi:hypothetical protein
MPYSSAENNIKRKKKKRANNILQALQVHCHDWGVVGAWFQSKFDFGASAKGWASNGRANHMTMKVQSRSL